VLPAQSKPANLKTFPALGGLSTVASRTACRGTCRRCRRHRSRGGWMILLVWRVNGGGPTGGDF
jgi:hypothetical protein